MAEGTNDNKVISKNNVGFPAWLDFDSLRRDAIDHLGKLSGKIWTDHNVHDPGITILEMLIYALLDLGYRTNLPAVDLFTPNPEDKNAPQHFLTPAKILANNPLTITDFRKLLVDLEHVRNAWLEVAQDYRREDYCYRDTDEVPDPCCITYLNGLYHVLVDLEKDLTPEQTEKTIDTIRKALLSHRNICEDFIDIKVLCKKPLGVCAELELEAGADVEKVYFEMMERLQDFFSPVPRFYTLQQLLDKNKTIDEIFAGRPIDVRDSHGFLDTEEFESLRLRRSIHLSDLYQVLLQVKGVRKVQKLELRACDGTPLKQQQGSVLLPEDHVPDFDIHCSGFRFYRNGIQLSFDSTQLDKLFELNTSGKIAYKYPSPYLDVEIPKGHYRADLDSYYSIQNEFPRVYGIGEGGLSDAASPERKAKALQLKGFLLFFDQLLANYLSQLKNLPTLFALSAPADKTQQHTYFINKLDSVPDLQQLLRFPLEDEAVEGLGNRGSILAFPIDRTDLQQWIDNGEIRKLDIEKLKSYQFTSIDDRKTAIQNWQQDVYQQQVQTTIVVKDNDCVFFYMTSSSDEIAFISKRYYANEQEARNAAATVLYLASIDTNYKSYYVPYTEAYTFDLELNLSTYTDYLQEIAEDADTYAIRRKGFLDHLLARFAEQFTDYALLSYGFLNNEELEKKNMEFEEKFLVNYDDISSKRGKGYDYLVNGWNNDNTSGFEKRFKALSGIEPATKHSLCNFEVGEYEAQFVFTLTLGNREFFAVPKEFISREDARKAAQAFFTGLAERERNTTSYIAYDQVYAVAVNDPASGEVLLREKFDTKEEAEKAADDLPEMFSEAVTKKDIFIASYQYSPKLVDDSGTILRVFDGVSEDETTVRANAIKGMSKINDVATWKTDQEAAPKFGRLLYDPAQAEPMVYLDITNFKIDVNNTIVGKPDLYTYELLDKNNRFKLRSVNEFENEKQARDDAHDLLILLLQDGHYSVQQDPESQKWQLQIKTEEKAMAVSAALYNSEEAAAKALKDVKHIVDALRYHIRVDKEPYTWRFWYSLGYGQQHYYLFESEQFFYGAEEALEGAKLFTAAIDNMAIQWEKNAVQLAPSKKIKNVNAVRLVNKGEISDEAFTKIKDSLEQELTIQQQIHALKADTEGKSFDRFVEKDPLSRQGQFVYRLVDKDKPYAFYRTSAGTEAAAQTLRKEAISKGSVGYFMLQLFVKGLPVIKRTDTAAKTTAWHYQLRAMNIRYTTGELAGQELVLFESVNGYETEDAAAEAFKKNYLSILQDALNKDNYGEGKPISTVELFSHTTDNCPKGTSRVYIPKATIDEFGDEVKAVDQLVNIAWTYPVRLIKYDPANPDSEWNKRFPCEEKKEKPNGQTACGQAADTWYYYFALYNKEVNTDDWQSIRYYQTIEEAWKDLEFFVLLLKYHGNYYIDCSCEGMYKIYLREVLAESVKRFIDKRSAWGSEGVEQFICVTQSPHTFHTLLHPQRCCYTFYVACENKRVWHSCKYDTPQRRDRAMQELYSGFKALDEKKPFSVEYRNEGYLLKNTKGEVFARAYPENQKAFSTCRWVEFILAMDDDKHFQSDDGEHHLVNAAGERLAESAETNMAFDDWKAQLRQIATYYESMITEDLSGQRKKYCLDLSFRNPDRPKERPVIAPSFCSDPVQDHDEWCDGWKTPCCFGSKGNALEYLLQVLVLLSDHTNYQPVFDCICDAYGIALHMGKPGRLENSACLVNDQLYVAVPEENQMIAFNPNCYPTPEMVCEAVQRAKQLVNSEGLHLVEHILLRPRCKPAPGVYDEDCGCQLEPCNNYFEEACEFPYWKDRNNEDPCDEREPVCFVPGSDPYSFIATVALPAWPERFRKIENRAMIEQLLRREAPAHVLLNILWLAPHDFCCFETNYKEWNRWLTQDGHCYAPDAACDLINFLFHNSFACLSECVVCAPCDGDQPVRKVCDEIDAGENDLRNRDAFHELIHQIYCWQTTCEPGYEFEECDKRNVVEPLPAPGIVAGRNRNLEAAKATKPPKAAAATTKPAKEVAPTAKALKEEKGTAKPIKGTEQPQKATEKKAEKEIAQSDKPEKELTKAAVPASVDAAAKRKAVNGRFTGYKRALDELVGSTKNNKTVAKARRFLDNPDPSVTEFNALVTEILQTNKAKTKGAKKPEAKWAPEVVTIVTHYLLDKYSFNGKDSKELSKSSSSFTLMQKAGIDMVELFNSWDPATVQRFEPVAKVTQVRKLLTGKK